MSTPPLTPAESAAIDKAAAVAAGEGLTPAELAAATALCDKQNRDELAAGYGAAAMPGDFADEARAVVAAVRSRIEAEALREFADANRFPNDWIMFRRDDGSGVTVPDLLREVAAGKLARQSLSRPTSKEQQQ